MNTSSLNATLDSEFIADLKALLKLNEFLSNYCYKYILPTTALLCTLTNTLNVAVFLNSRITGLTHQYLLWKSIFELLIGVVMVFSMLFFCSDCALTRSYLSQVYVIYLFSACYYFLYYAASFVEVAVTYERLLILKNKSGRSRLLDARFFIPLVACVAFTWVVPIAFLFDIVPSGPGEFTIVRSKFASSLFILIETALSILVFNLAFDAIMITLTLRVMVNFRRYAERKLMMTVTAAAATTAAHPQRNRTKNKTTKMVIFICLLCIYLHLVEMAFTVFNGLTTWFPDNLKYAFWSSAFLFITKVNSTLVFSGSIFIYLYYNNVYRRVFFSYFHNLSCNNRIFSRDRTN